MKKFFSNDMVSLICRLVFGIIFIYASLDKMQSPEQFARIVYNYHLLPSSLINIFSLILPISEMLSGILLILGLFYKGSRNYLVIILLIFIAAISINVFRGISLECGCFTVSSKAKSHGWSLVLRDVAYLIPGVILMFSNSRRWMMDNLFFKKS